MIAEEVPSWELLHNDRSIKIASRLTTRKFRNSACLRSLSELYSSDIAGNKILCDLEEALIVSPSKQSPFYEYLFKQTR